MISMIREDQTRPQLFLPSLSHTLPSLCVRNKFCPKQRFESLGVQWMHTFIDTHISSWSYWHQKPYSKTCFKQLLCPNSSQCSRRQWKLFLLHFYLIYTGLCIIRNLLLCTCRFLIILGIANLAWASRHYFCLLIHCFGSTVIYRPKPATVKDATSFTVFSTSDRNQKNALYFLFFTK